MIDDLWYKNAIFYCLHVGAFMDANGDGIGDFEGLVRRLDYLAGLGVTAVWLMPFQPTPNRDDGYDISDYYGVDPRFGSAGDFVEFTQQARAHGMRVIMDLVINHTSDQHPWFQEGRRDPKSRYRDFYCWSKTKPPHANTGMVFPGVQKSTWTYDKEAKAYYFHRFYKFQPDLNFQNPAVKEEVRKVMGYWLELGVSGFRVDAVPFVIEEAPLGNKPAIKHFEYLRDLHDVLQWRTGDGILLGEANILPGDNAKYFGAEGDRMHMILNFQVNQHMFYALATGDVRPLARAVLATQLQNETSQWGTFLRTHDEQDLGRLTKRQRQRVFEAFAPEPSMRLYDRGIRRRLAPMLGGDPRRIEHAHSFLMSLPGTPVLRYGDEIGMGDDQSLPERQSVRTPMQWTPDAQGGFSMAEKTMLPVIAEGPFRYERVNVADQRRDPESLVNATERLIRMRKECPELGWGKSEMLATGSDNVLALASTWRGNTVVCVHNFAAEARDITLSFPAGRERQLTNLLSRDHSVPDARGRHRISIQPYGYRWYRVGAQLEAATREPR
jgi:maltose alpha-D-glucosyltransferase/alpha-amylase